jgi:hypothetical protein
MKCFGLFPLRMRMGEEIIWLTLFFAGDAEKSSLAARRIPPAVHH